MSHRLPSCPLIMVLTYLQSSYAQVWAWEWGFLFLYNDYKSTRVSHFFHRGFLVMSDLPSAQRPCFHFLEGKPLQHLAQL